MRLKVIPQRKISWKLYDGSDFIVLFAAWLLAPVYSSTKVVNICFWNLSHTADCLRVGRRQKRQFTALYFERLS